MPLAIHERYCGGAVSLPRLTFVTALHSLIHQSYMTVQKLLLSFGVQDLLAFSEEPLTLNVSFRSQVRVAPRVQPLAMN